MNVIAGLSKCLLARDCTAKGTPVLTWPSDRNGANSRSRLGPPLFEAVTAPALDAG